MKLLCLAALGTLMWHADIALAAPQTAEPFRGDFLQGFGLTNQPNAGIPSRLNTPSTNFPLKQFVFPTNLLQILTNGAPMVFFGTNPVLNLPSGNFRAPGVYKTEPFACIVVVPGAHADERMVINPGKTESKMPITEPPVSFIPLKSGQR